MALAERYAAQQEVLLEFGPLIGVGDPVFADGPKLSAPFDECLVGGDEVLGKDCLWRVWCRG